MYEMYMPFFTYGLNSNERSNATFYKTIFMNNI